MLCLVVNTLTNTKLYAQPSVSSYIVCYVFLLRFIFFIAVMQCKETTLDKFTLFVSFFKSSPFFQLCFKIAFNLFPKFFKDIYRDIKCLAKLCCTRSHISATQQHSLKKDGFLVFFFSSKYSLLV